MARDPNVTEVDDSNFDREVLKSELPVLVDFATAWCPPCRVLAPIVAQVAGENIGRVKVVSVDTDNSPAVAQRYGIMSVPTLIVFRKGESAARQVGAVSRAKVLAMLAS